jgi:hypothetical protein
MCDCGQICSRPLAGIKNAANDVLFLLLLTDDSIYGYNIKAER